MNNAEKRDLEQALALIKETGRCSVAMLQRRMAISYNHAAKLIKIIGAESFSCKEVGK